jgi:hypothetical protein
MNHEAAIIGGFGNQLFQWAVGYSTALSLGARFVVSKCLLDDVFHLPEHDIAKEGLPFRTYGQDQSSLTYTRSQAREWFKFKTRIKTPSHPVVAHVRRGDYPGAGYPVISEKAFITAAGTAKVHFVSNEKAGGIDHTCSFLPDFFTLMAAKKLYRSNSAFSWWAAVLGDNEAVLSPRIEGLKAGKEHDEVPFEEGNHCKLADLPMCSDLYLEP